MRYALPVVVLLLLAAPAQAAGVVWRGWNAGLAAAAVAKKPVIVDVYTDWCGWCKRMDREVYSRADVSEYLNAHFVMVRLNAEARDAADYKGKRYTSQQIASGFEVTGYPTMIFLRSDGEHMVNIPGFVPADKFLKLAHYVGDGHMDRGVSWEDYSKQAAPAAKKR